MHIPQVLPAASWMCPAAPQLAPHEFLILQTPVSLTPTRTTPWFKFYLQLEKTPPAKKIKIILTIVTPVAGINCNSDWLFLNCILKLLTTVQVNISNNSIECSFNIFAWLVNSLVWVSFSCSKSIILNIFITWIHPSTIASLISISSWAINQILFRKVDYFIELDFGVDFECTNCWEGPAWTTLSLILDWWCFSGFFPIDGSTIWVICIVDLSWNLALWHLQVQVCLSEFLLAQVSKLIDFQCVCMFFWTFIKGLDHIDVAFKHLETIPNIINSK